ncbi:hypothetical protein [Microcoleus sp. FACHB-672]|uniref:hypothetical protein n=1 Tax=Microcoleus sp. FACHB-672 TaxID=2692825 RepID=UPI0016853E1A|nr:hypothetical protein [Microcoleus sp. FACHB-672]MBD2039701.1 hypothetical protein [Microcoleus sp. FACHB-672]
MQGILAGNVEYDESAAIDAVIYADALLDALEGKKETYSVATPPNITEEETHD